LVLIRGPALLNFSTRPCTLIFVLLAAMGLVVLFILLPLSYFVLSRFSKSSGIPFKHIATAWSLKLLFASAYSYVFLYYYGKGEPDLDLFNFFNDSRELYQYGLNDPAGYLKLLFGFGADDELLLSTHLSNTYIWEYPYSGELLNDCRVLIRINSVIHFFSFNDIRVHIFVMTLISMTGLLLIVAAFKKFNSNPKLTLYFLAAFPSIAFWSSGVTKEALMCLGVGLFFFALFRLMDKKTVGTVLLLLLAIFLMIYNKPHVGFVVMMCSLAIPIGRMLKWKMGYAIVLPLCILMAGIGLSYAPEKINLISKTTLKQKDLINMSTGGVYFINDTAFCAFDYGQIDHFLQHDKFHIQVLQPVTGTYKLFGKDEFKPIEIQPDSVIYDLYLVQVPANSYVEVMPINYSGMQLVMNIPEALINVFIRPFPSDPGSTLKYFASSTNILFLIVLLLTIFYRQKCTNEQWYIIVSLFCAAIVIALMIGWTTPILGAVFRYKCAVDMLLVLAAAIIIKPIQFRKK